MLKRPVQIWGTFVLCVAIALPAMAWLTLHTVRIHHARDQLLIETEVDRRRAEQQDLVTAAIWRMDSMLTPLVGPEATRPYAFYQPLLTIPSVIEKDESSEPLLSPLLSNPSQYVLIHFQIDDQENWTSPQSPFGAACDFAITCGVPASRIESSCVRLDELKTTVDGEDWLERLPTERLRQYAANDPQFGFNDYNGLASNFGQSLNTAEYENRTLSQLRAPVYQSAGGRLDPGQTEEQPEQQVEGQVPPSQLAERGDSSRWTEDQLAQNSRLNNRGGRDWQQRHAAYQSYANTAQNQQSLAVSNSFRTDSLIQEGVAQWMWIKDELVLARKVHVNGREQIQGCWLDWPSLKQQLLNDVSDLLTDIELLPVTTEADVLPELALATLPVQLSLENPAIESQFDAESFLRQQDDSRSPLQTTLIFAWSCFAFATLALAGLLRGVVRLSERRGAFVSAVTHELRTPLTTFRMYAEMLHQDIVSDESKRKDYLQTLRVEADRLTHLVDNVLAYSRLERGTPGKRREEIALGELAERMEQRLQDRASQAGMELILEFSGSDRKQLIRTDPGAIDQIVFNLVENACKYALNPDDRRIHVEFLLDDTHLCIQVRDHGQGISSADRRRLFRPFSKSVERAAETAPGVGLGLALCRRLAHDLGGQMRYVGDDDSGAVFELSLPLKG